MLFHCHFASDLLLPDVGSAQAEHLAEKSAPLPTPPRALGARECLGLEAQDIRIRRFDAVFAEPKFPFVVEALTVRDVDPQARVAGLLLAGLRVVVQSFLPPCPSGHLLPNKHFGSLEARAFWIVAVHHLGERPARVQR